MTPSHRRRLRAFFSLSIVSLIAHPAHFLASEPASGGYADSDAFEPEIEAFEALDAVEFPAPGGVVFAGSSSIRMWHPWLAEDLAPLTVIGRGFGGSNMNDLNRYAERIVFKYKPRAIVIYEGDNDVNSGVASEAIVKSVQTFFERAQERLPGSRVYFVSIKPSAARWELWPRMQEVNRRVAALCSAEENFTYVDFASVLLGEDGLPNPELFAEDKLHLNREGYLLWKAVAQREIVPRESAFEK